MVYTNKHDTFDIKSIRNDSITQFYYVSANVIELHFTDNNRKIHTFITQIGIEPSTE